MPMYVRDPFAVYTICYWVSTNGLQTCLMIHLQQCSPLVSQYELMLRLLNHSHAYRLEMIKKWWNVQTFPSVLSL